LLHDEASHWMSTRVLTSSSSAHWFWGANRQTSSHLVLMSKSRNRRSDFETQITKSSTLVLSPKPRNCHGDFEAKITKPLTLVLSPNYWQTVATGFEAIPKNPRFSSPPRVRCRSHIMSPDLSIVWPPSTQFVTDHSRSSTLSLILMPRSSSLSVMSHSPPTRHETSKHISPYPITQYELVQSKYDEFKFKVEQVSYSSHI
jgi:hypothetical protein